MCTLDEFLTFLENEVQIAALSIFALMYLAKLLWLKSLRSPVEKAPPKGSAARGVLLSFGSVLWPWAMESSRKHFAVFVEFALFHIAVAIAIGATFIVPYAPQLLTPRVVDIFSIFLAIGFVAGLIRVRRRLTDPSLRAINTPDDYFAIVAITIYFAVAIWGLVTQSYWGMVAYFGLTTFLLIYVPLSKISHYIYIPFTRFYYGYLFGRRGVMVPNRRWR